ncbi:TetR/AcrR family transcriptional regulator [Roseomonas haemaphysalidis]|uniref:TetR family transcriptional regulator n=1 Tax=Roseomonas haemaphysalidis TaxID=2768162 RepID=A0ABS3KJR5_9PROT|nr:TetR family transcriptional regulator [Roseomonas haemaphysalidis]MBO1077709.1 TetR family transcriptional regulator [Roseomonas haemaphysalidis]
MMDQADRPRRGRRAAGATNALNRDKIVLAALALLDERGLAAFSVRDLAKAMGVFPAAIYWHVPSRNQLLAAIVAHVLRDLAPPPMKDWRDWLRALFRRYRAAVRAHPTIAPLIGAQLVSNTGLDFAMIEAVLRVLSGAGFEGQRLVDAFNVVTAAQVGFVTLEFAPPPPEGADEWVDGMRALVGSVPAGDYPMLAAHMPRMHNRSFTLRWQNGTVVPLDSSFEAYVETVVAGLERLAQRGA